MIETAVGTFSFAKIFTGTVVAIILAFIIFGGVKRIANFTQIVVPFMALAYIIIAFVIILLLARQISEPVRWVETINNMHDHGVDRLIECGPGKVLCGLSKRITSDISCIPLINMDYIATALEA